MSPVDGAAQPQQSHAFEMEAPAGRWQAAGLTGLAVGAHLDFVAKPDGEISLHLMHQERLGDLPDTSGALYSASGDGTIRFSFIVAKAGDHALILDNREGDEDRTAQIRISATAPGGLTPDQYEAQANRMLTATSEAMGRVFRFGDPGLHTAPCGVVAPFAPDAPAQVCLEFSAAILGRVPDPTVASPVMMFAIFTRVAELVAAEGARELAIAERDHLAAAVMSILGYRAQAEAATAWLGGDAAAALLDELEAGQDRLPDPSRAAAIADALAAGRLEADWSSVVLRALSEPTLQRMLDATPGWTDRHAVQQELAARDS